MQHIFVFQIDFKLNKQLDHDHYDPDHRDGIRYASGDTGVFFKSAFFLKCISAQLQGLSDLQSLWCRFQSYFDFDHPLKGVLCPPGFILAYGSFGGRGFYSKNMKVH